jgi:hypothetical protein
LPDAPTFDVDDGRTLFGEIDASAAEERPAPWCGALAGLGRRTWYIGLSVLRILT